MSRIAQRLLVEDEGATMVEYALMIGLIAAAAIAVIGGLSAAVNKKFTSMSTSLG